MQMVKYGETSNLNFTTNETYYHAIKTAYQQQKAIGIHMIWRGIITQKLGDIQEDTYRRGKFDRSFTGTNWARMVVNLFLTHFENLWEKRNSLLPNNLKLVGEREYLQEKIDTILKSKPEIPIFLRSFYNRGEVLRHTKSAKIKNLKRWIDVISDIKAFNEFQEVRD